MAKAAKPTKLALTRRRNAARRIAQRRKAPSGRLSTDGCWSKENVRRRLQWLAHEWKIPADRLPKASDIGHRDRGIGRLLWSIQRQIWMAVPGRSQRASGHDVGSERSSQRDPLMQKISQLTPEQQAIVQREAERLLRLQAAEEPEPAWNDAADLGSATGSGWWHTPEGWGDNVPKRYAAGLEMCCPGGALCQTGPLKSPATLFEQ